jgi:hypothetical protein
MHIHVGALDFFITAAYIIIFAYIWRALAAHWSGNSLGQAMAFIF